MSEINIQKQKLQTIADLVESIRDTVASDPFFISDFFQEYTDFTEKVSIYRKDRSLEYLLPALTAELGEVCSIFAKVERDKDGKLSNEDLKALEKELGDVFWMLFRLMGHLGIYPLDVILNNVNKLYSRLRRGTLSGSGDDR